MRRLLLLVCAALLMSCATSSVAPESPQLTVDRLVTAFNRLDIDAVEALFTEDATAFLPLPQYPAQLRGRAAIIAVLRPMFEGERARHEGPEYLHMTAKDFSITSSGDVAVAAFDVGVGELHSRRTLVLVRRGTTWKIMHLHGSNVRPQQ